MKYYDWNELSPEQQADVIRQWPPAAQEGVDCVGLDDGGHPVYVNSRLPHRGGRTLTAGYGESARIWGSLRNIIPSGQENRAHGYHERDESGLPTVTVVSWGHNDYYDTLWFAPPA